MKFLKFAFTMTVLVISLISCQKDDESNDKPKSVAGTWEGKWGFENQTPSYYVKWELAEDGNLQAFFQEDGILDAVGSWDQDGDEIAVHYTLLDGSYSFSYYGPYDEDNDEITGNWIEDDYASSGTFVMQRQ